MDCGYCRGTGFVKDKDCSKCGGSGVILDVSDNY
jgi:DnaJ-class molecular chaperone